MPDALTEQLYRSIDRAGGGRRYTDLLLSTRYDENGKNRLWFLNLAPRCVPKIYDLAEPTKTIPDVLDYTDDRYLAVT